MGKELISKETHDRLLSELHDLKTIHRPEIIKQVGEAFDLGDLPENAEWDAARSAQSKNEGRIAYLEDLLKRVEIIDYTTMEKEFITEEKKAELEVELHHLKAVARPEIGNRVATARAFGDLSENAEYHAARSEQGKNEDRIMEIESVLKRAAIITRSGSDRVELGATVVVKKIDSNEEKKYMIVSDTEANIEQNKISLKSPIGSQMMDKKAGENFVFSTPRGDVEYTIVSIS